MKGYFLLVVVIFLLGVITNTRGHHYVGYGGTPIHHYKVYQGGHGYGGHGYGGHVYGGHGHGGHGYGGHGYGGEGYGEKGYGGKGFGGQGFGEHGFKGQGFGGPGFGGQGFRGFKGQGFGQPELGGHGVLKPGGSIIPVSKPVEAPVLPGFVPSHTSPVDPTQDVAIHARVGHKKEP